MIENSLTLTDKKEQLKIKAESLLNEARKEARKLSADEETEYNDLCKQIADIDNEIRDLSNKLNNKKEVRKMEKFSLLKAIRAIANNQTLDERSQEVVNTGIEEMRKSGQSYSGQIILPVEERAAIVAGTATNGKEVVAEDKLNILAPLRDKLVMYLFLLIAVQMLVGVLRLLQLLMGLVLLERQSLVLRD